MENIEHDCCICGSNDKLVQVREKWLCEQCLRAGNEILMTPWKHSIEKMIKEYADACYGCLESDKPDDIHKTRVLGRKIQSVLQFIGLPKKHNLLFPIRQVQLILKRIQEGDVLLDQIEEQNEENKVNAEMVTLLVKKQKKAHQLLSKRLPVLVNDQYLNQVEIFAREELTTYLVPFDKKIALRKFEERFKRIFENYHQTVQEMDKAKASLVTFELLHKIRKQARSLNDIYSYLNEVFGEKDIEKEDYYKDIQGQIRKVDEMKDWLDHLNAYEKNINAPKKERKAAKDQLKERMEFLIKNIKLNTVPVKE